MKDRLDNEVIALRVSREFFDGSVVNLGAGLPALCAFMIPEEKTILMHIENGALGIGRPLRMDELDKIDPHLYGAGGRWITAAPGMSCFDHDRSFDMIRGGHIDITVLGAFQVSEKGDLANWYTHKRPLPSMGGAMDLAVGAKKVIVAMEHTTKDGDLKIVKECSYPLTGRQCVKLIVTDLAVIEVVKDGLLLKELAPNWSVEEVQALTEPKLIVAKDLKEIEL